MRATAIHRYGGPEEFVEIELPDPTPDERDLMIEVHATSVNPVDAKIRRGEIGRDHPMPLVLGYDVSGVVVRKGPSATMFNVGDEVYASPSLGRPGADADYVLVDERLAAKKPSTLAHAAAAALPLVTITAWEALLDRAKIRPGETVLVHAGAGGVGHVACQLALHRGCRVFATASRPDSMRLLRELGADEIIDYSVEDFVEKVREITGGDGVNVVFDTVGGATFERSLQSVALDGRIVTILGTPTAEVAALFPKNATIHYEFMGAAALNGQGLRRKGEILAAAAELVDDGDLGPHVSREFRPPELPEAHRAIETRRTVGKLVVRRR